MKELIKKYGDLVIEDGLSYSKAASLLLKDNLDCKQAHRTVRRSISKYCKSVEIKAQKGKKSVDVTKEGTKYSYDGETCITTLEQAIDFFDIDTDEYVVDRVIFNAWDVTSSEGKRTNYQVKVFTSKKEKEFDYDDLRATLDKWVKEYTPRKVEGTDIGVVAITDIHVGAKTNAAKGTILTKEFGTKELIKYLDETATWINKQGKQEVHLSILGDLVETVTGLNHLNSWQGVEEDAWYGNTIILAYEVLFDFLQKVNNLHTVYMVAGNHDRMSVTREGDAQGDVAKLVAYMLAKNFQVKYHPMVVSEVIDGISYVFTHNHLKLSNQTLSKVILDYGDQKCYNVVMGGHYHSRNTKKEFYKMDHLIQDSVNYRGIVVAPLFTGNWYSESSGWTSSAGFSYCEANSSKTNITHIDVGL